MIPTGTPVPAQLVQTLRDASAELELLLARAQRDRATDAVDLGDASQALHLALVALSAA